MRYHRNGHHPSIETVVGVRTIIMSNAISDGNLAEALKQIDKALEKIGEMWDTCLACLALTVPLYRIKSDCLFKLQRFSEATEWHEAYTEKSQLLVNLGG